MAYISQNMLQLNRSYVCMCSYNFFHESKSFVTVLTSITARANVKLECKDKKKAN